MSDAVEVLVTSESSCRFWSACVWDFQTGNILHCYKSGGVITPNTLKFIKNDFVISAECLKPLLHVWPINSQEIMKNIRLVCPGRVVALDVTEDGNFLAAAIAEQLYIWQVSSGNLLAIASKHFQPITKVAFSSDGAYIVTSGEDGLVLIWSLVHLISKHSNVAVRTEQIDPIHTISDHSLAVKDFYVGKLGKYARLVTVSADRTMKIYEVSSKNLLLTVVFDVCLTAVTMDLSENSVFVGTTEGNIYEISLLNPPRNREYHAEPNKNPCFKGHKKSITTLSVSMDGRFLASGSQDEEVIIWHIQTKQKIRSLPHKGAINHAFFMTTPKNMFVQDLKPTTVINSFSRTVLDEQSTFAVEVVNTSDQKLPYDSPEVSPTKKLSVQNNEINNDVDLLKEIENLKAINSKLYQFTLNKILDEPKMVFFGDVSSKKETKKRKLIEN